MPWLFHSSLMYANLYGSPHRSQETSTLNGARLVLNSTTPFTPALVRSSLTQVSNPEEIYASRVQGRQIRLENPAQPSKTKQQLQQKRARKKAARVKRKWAPSTEHEGLWKLSTSEAKYVTIWFIAKKKSQANQKLFSPQQDTTYSFRYIIYGWATYQSCSLYNHRYQHQHLMPCQMPPPCMPSLSKQISTGVS